MDSYPKHRERVHFLFPPFLPPAPPLSTTMGQQRDKENHSYVGYPTHADREGWPETLLRVKGWPVLARIQRFSRGSPPLCVTARERERCPPTFCWHELFFESSLSRPPVANWYKRAHLCARLLTGLWRLRAAHSVRCNAQAEAFMLVQPKKRGLQRMHTQYLDPENITAVLFFTFISWFLNLETAEGDRVAIQPLLGSSPCTAAPCLRSTTHSQGYISVCCAFGCKRCRSCGSPVVRRCARIDRPVEACSYNPQVQKKSSHLVCSVAGSPISTHHTLFVNPAQDRD